ncbi:ankyrin repeat-containing domain protein, partial [Immersiella caudata]
QTPLHWAAKYDRRELAELMITRYKADVSPLDQDYQTPLHLAVEANLEAMIRLLLRHKAETDVRSKRLTPFVYAVKHGLYAAAKALAENKVEIDAEDINHGTPLTWAMHYMNLGIVELLLVNGWDVNWQKSDGWTALRCAAQHGNELMTKLLLKHNAKVDLCDRWSRRTPLRWAVLYGHTRIVQILVEYGADINSRCKDGETPLMQAVKREDASVVWFLVDKRADMNVQNKDGATALHLAVRHGSKSIVWLLIESGARADAQDNEGMTPL